MGERNTHEWEQANLVLDRIETQVEMVEHGEYLTMERRIDMQAATRAAVKGKLERAKKKLRAFVRFAAAAGGIRRKATSCEAGKAGEAGEAAGVARALVS